MKKLTTALLCLLMVFSCAFCVNAEDANLEEEQSETIDNKVYQDENGDVIIEAPVSVVDKLLVGTTNETEKCYLTFNLTEKNFGGVGNYSDGENVITLLRKGNNSNQLIASKDDLVKYGFIDGTYDVKYRIGNYIYSFFDGVKLDLGNPSTKENSIKLIGNIAEPKVGESTLINLNNYQLLGNNKIENFDVYWGYRWQNQDGYVYYVKTDDEVFVDGNDYYLIVEYRYVGVSDLIEKTVELTCDNHTFENVTLGKGATGIPVAYYLGFESEGYSQFASEKFTPSNSDSIAKIGDVEYATLQEAINAAKNGEEIVLLNDVKEYINVPDKTKAVLKMNGKTIDSDTEARPTFYINHGATVDFQGQGFICNNLMNAIIVNFGRCRINGPTVFGTMGKDGKSSVIWNKGLLVVESGKITAADTLTPYIYGMNEFVVTGGELGNGKLLIEEKDTHTFKLYGGTYNCSEKDLLYYLGDGCCFAKDSEGLITIVKATNAPIKEPTVVGNKENIDSVKDTKGLEDVTNVGIKLENKKNDDLKDEEKKALDTFVKENVNTDVEHHTICLDLKLVGVKDDGTKVDEITNVLAKPLTVTVALSDTDVNILKGKTIKVIRYHTNDDGTIETTYLDAELNGNELTFKTDRFSTYVVVGYKAVTGGSTPATPTTPESKPSVSSPSKAGPKDLNADGIITCDEEMGSANWIWSEAKGACVYKVSNTSVK